MSAWFPLHEFNQSLPSQCGGINLQTGMIYKLAMEFIVQQINKNNSLLKGITLKPQVIDTCSSSLKMKGDLQRLLLFESPKCVIGPESSPILEIAAPIFDVFNIPFISYSASSTALDNRKRFSNVFRTVPSDEVQIEALVALFEHYEWNYVRMLFSEEHMDFETKLQVYFSLSDICISFSQHLVPEDESDASLTDLVKRVTDDGKDHGTVLLLITSTYDTVRILRSLISLGRQNKFVLVGTTHWGNYFFKEKALREAASGALVLQHESKRNEEFEKYFESQNPSTNNNTYFREFWEEIFNCSLSLEMGKCNSNLTISIGMSFYEHTPLEQMSDAIYAYAKALDIICGHETDSSELDLCLKTINSMSDTLRNNITSESGAKMFSPIGTMSRALTILNYRLHQTENDLRYVKVGRWDTDSQLNIFDDNITWPYLVQRGEQKNPISVCSLPCKVGFIKVMQLQKCCWKCQACPPNNFVKDNKCHKCKMDSVPDESGGRCVKLIEKHVVYSSGIGAAIVVFSTLGMLLTASIMFFMFYLRKSAIVRASSRELSLLILAGIIMCFLSSLVFLNQPTRIACGAQRFIAGLSLCTCYAPLFLKTNRIYRIFKSSLKLQRPSLVSSLSQVLVALGVVCLQVLLGVMWVIGDPPKITQSYPKHRKYIVVYCETDSYTMGLNLAICLVLMMTCTVFAFKTRNFPKNFNESASILRTMYASCLCWAVFLPLYINVSDENLTKTYSISMFCTVIGFVTLIGLFIARVRLVIMNTVEPLEKVEKATKRRKFVFDIENSIASHSTISPPLATRSTVMSLKVTRNVSTSTTTLNGTNSLS